MNEINNKYTDQQITKPLTNLYLDHQSIAPLVRLLETAVQTCTQQQKGQDMSTSHVAETSQVRNTLYRHFLSIIHNLFLERNPHLKNEDGSIKLEALPEFLQTAVSPPDVQGLIAETQPQILSKKHPSTKVKKGPSGRAAEVQRQLMEWIASCEKRIFEKKQIDAKYRELIGDSRRTLSLTKLGEAVERSEIPALIVKTRNGEEHFFGANLDVSASTEAKVEENSVQRSIWQQDDRKTVKNSFSSAHTQPKQENRKIQFEPNTTQPLNAMLQLHPKVPQEQSFDSLQP